jgi:hypothetical protein
MASVRSKPAATAMCATPCGGVATSLLQSLPGRSPCRRHPLSAASSQWGQPAPVAAGAASLCLWFISKAQQLFV